MMSTATQPSDAGSNQRKEVFAWFGGAVYYAQCFETELITLLIITERMKNRGLSAAQVDDLEEKLSAKTLGTLLAEFRKHLNIGTDIDDCLKTALGHRNRLAHHYFWQHAEDLLSSQGCEAMIQELRAMSEELRLADSIATQISGQLIYKLGIPADLLERQMRVERQRLADFK